MRSCTDRRGVDEVVDYWPPKTRKNSEPVCKFIQSGNAPQQPGSESSYATDWGNLTGFSETCTLGGWRHGGIGWSAWLLLPLSDTLAVGLLLCMRETLLYQCCIN